MSAGGDKGLPPEEGETKADNVEQLFSAVKENNVDVVSQLLASRLVRDTWTQ